MIKNFKILLIITFVGTPIAFLTLWIVVKVKKFEARKYFKEIKNNKQYYCYDLSTKALNASFYVENLADTKKLEQYYDSTNFGKNPSFSFPIKFVVLFKKVYAIGNPIKNDNKITEFVDFDTTCYGYVHGYTYTKNLYATLADSSLIKHHIEVRDSIQNSPEYKRIQNMQQLSSPYGLQCDCNW